ncbi:MAG: creatininase family protein [Lentisphaeria bacterium]|nr:creatininase family protein [Lentisphaeria bacterium]
MRTRLMGEMTVKEVREYLKSNQTIVFPYGVVEQHGYHLPLNTDNINAENFALALAEKLDCIVAPCLNYCFSGGQLAGTINVKPTNFCNMVCDIMEALVNQGFRNIFITPGHAGSESLVQLKEALRILKWLNPGMKDAMIMIICRGEFFRIPAPADRKGGDFHAGDLETSLMLNYRPDLVQLPAVAVDRPEIAEKLRIDPDAYQQRTTFSGLPQEIPNTRQDPAIEVGVMGYPGDADPAKGILYTEKALEKMMPLLKKAVEDAEKARNQ